MGPWWRWGKREIIYLSLHCHHQHDSCFNLGSDERCFNVLLFVTDKVTRQCSQTTTSEERGEPKRNRTDVLLLKANYQPNALPLGQTGLPLLPLLVSRSPPVGLSHGRTLGVKQAEPKALKMKHVGTRAVVRKCMTMEEFAPIRALQRVSNKADLDDDELMLNVLRCHEAY